MATPANAKLIVGGGLLAGAAVMLAAAAAVYWEALPALGLGRNILAVTLAGMAVMDSVLAVVFLTRS